MLAAVPIVGCGIVPPRRQARAGGVRILGLATGAGVALLVGLDSLSDIDPLSVIKTLVVAICYAVGPAIARKLDGVPSMERHRASLAHRGDLPVRASLSSGLPSAA
jgi:hypothetical protein